MASNCSPLNTIGASCTDGMSTTEAKILAIGLPGVTFTDEADFMDNASFLTKIAAGELITVSVKETEAQNVEAKFQEYTSGEKDFLLPAIKGRRYKVKLDLDQQEQALKMSGQQIEIFTGDRNNFLHGIKNEDGTIRGKSIGFLYVSEQQDGNSETVPLTFIDVQDADTYEWDNSGVYGNPGWRVPNLPSLTTLTASAGTITTGVFTLTTKFVSGHRIVNGAYFERSVTVPAAENLIIYDETGALVDTGNITVAPVAGQDGVVTVTTTPAITAGTVQVTGDSTFLFNSNVLTLA